MRCFKLHIILLVCLLLSSAEAWSARRDSVRTDTIYQGLYLKTDVANAIAEPIIHAGKRQSYEFALAVNLKHRFFPTIEVGYASAHQTTDLDSIRVDVEQWSNGVFGRVGMDISMTKLRDPKQAHNKLLLGFRVGVAGPECDVWGEVHFGAQVEICKRFLMGWSIRERILFTKKNEAFYIPGYGERKNNRLGFNYYLGVRL